MIALLFQDIEITSRLVGLDVDNDDSLDEKYNRLHCGISPLSHNSEDYQFHNSEDYQLIEKYLQATHALNI
jgi:poly [ADP-ribose] polymerase 1